MNIIKTILRNIYSFVNNIYYRFLLVINKLKIEEFDDTFFGNKRVIVIGPAESALNYLSPEEIDNFDVIVRMNKSHLILDEYKSLGSRTDILFHCCHQDPVGGCGSPDEIKLLEQKNIFVIYPYDEKLIEYKFYKCLYQFRKLKFKKLNKSYYVNILKKYTAKMPTTGYQTLNYLIKQNFQELHITGFTFLQTSYVKGYRTGYESSKNILSLVSKGKNHDVECEFELFSNEIKRLKNIYLDDTLHQMVYNSEARE